MRKSPLALLVALSLAGVAACGSSEERDEGGGFTESDRQAARQFVRLKAESPALEALPDGLITYLRRDSLAPAKKTLRQLRRAAKRFRRLVPKFDDRRARRAMQAFADGSSDVASSYGKVVRCINREESSPPKAYVALRELETAVDETNAADRRLSNLEAPS
jgi:hypothetical protein